MVDALRSSVSTAKPATLAALAAAGIVFVGLALALVGVHGGAAALVVLGVGTLSIIRPEIGLWLVLLLFPIHPLLTRVAQIDLGFGSSSFLVISAWKEVAIVGMLVGLAVPRLRRSPAEFVRGSFRSLVLPDWMAIALGLLVIIALVMGPTSLALSQARLLLFPLGVYIGARANLIPGARMFKGVTAVGAGVAAFGIIQSSVLGWSFVERYYSAPGMPRPYTFTAQFLEGPRAAGTLLSPNEFAFMMVIYVAMTAALIYRLPPRQKVWFAPVLTLLVIGLALSFSRSALLAGIVGFAFAIVLLPRLAIDARRTTLIVAAGLVPALVLTVIIYEDRGGGALLANTVQTLVGGGPASSPAPTASPAPGGSAGPGGTAVPTASTAPDSSTVAHVGSLREGLRLVAANPLGIGLGNVGARPAPGSTETPGYIVESWFLAMGLMLGWLGLLWAVAFPLMLGLMAYLVWVRRRDPLSAIALVVVVPAVVIIGIALPTLAEPQVAMFPWAICGLAVVALGGRGLAATPTSE